MIDPKRARPLHRVVAKFIDLTLVMVLAYVIPYPYGPLVGFLYSLMSDALPFRGFRGQSIGKKVFRLQVVSVTEGRELGWKDSLFRNAPVGVATFFSLIPVWGWAILALVGFPLMIIEIYLLIRAPRGQRLGDVMANTEVLAIPR